MEQQIQIRCKNNKKTLNISIGSTLSEIFSLTGLQMEYGPISARVNNKVEGMHFRVYKPKDIEFLDLHNSFLDGADDGRELGDILFGIPGGIIGSFVGGAYGVVRGVIGTLVGERY